MDDIKGLLISIAEMRKQRAHIDETIGIYKKRVEEAMDTDHCFSANFPSVPCCITKQPGYQITTIDVERLRAEDALLYSQLVEKFPKVEAHEDSWRYDFRR